jgi:hypothetical protein
LCKIDTSLSFSANLNHCIGCPVCELISIPNELFQFLCIDVDDVTGSFVVWLIILVVDLPSKLRAINRTGTYNMAKNTVFLQV